MPPNEKRWRNVWRRELDSGIDPGFVPDENVMLRKRKRKTIKSKRKIGGKK
jgi:hypothetical protein